MYRTTRIAALVSLAMAAAAAAAGDAKPVAVKSAEFDSLKRLAGEWQLEDPNGQMQGTVKYQITSVGSTIVETMGLGTPYEMVTLYTRDGDKVAVTHYCGAGNQPHLLSTPASSPKQLHFDFVSAGNMKSPQEEHMHSLTLTFIDDNQLKQEWQSYKDGKPSDKTVFTLKRKT